MPSSEWESSVCPRRWLQHRVATARHSILKSPGSKERKSPSEHQAVGLNIRGKCRFRSNAARSIGEFQHADPGARLTAIGDVLSGQSPGRRSADDITVLDSSGLSLQDLYVTQAIIEAHMMNRTQT